MMGIPACPGKMDVKQDFSRKKRIRWLDGGGRAIEEHSFNTERFAAATYLNFPFEWVAEEPLEWCLPHKRRLYILVCFAHPQNPLAILPHTAI